MAKSSASGPKKSDSLLGSAKTIYDLQAEICAAMASPVRLQILEAISHSEKTATDLIQEIPIPKANMSQHLAVLRDAGIVHSRKVGLFHYFSLAIPRIREACALVRSVLVERIANEDKKNTELIRRLKIQR